MAPRLWGACYRTWLWQVNSIALTHHYGWMKCSAENSSRGHPVTCSESPWYPSKDRWEPWLLTPAQNIFHPHVKFHQMKKWPLSFMYSHHSLIKLNSLNSYSLLCKMGATLLSHRLVGGLSEIIYTLKSPWNTVDRKLAFSPSFLPLFSPLFHHLFISSALPCTLHFVLLDFIATETSIVPSM